MQRTPVASSAVKSIGYDAEEETLEVEFANGGVYRYLEVPADEHERLLAAESIGTYMNVVIKPSFPCRKL
ncbi:MAG TPA: KTSC domain-containing protein [Longimicrobiaceae bacterium]|nr:KTSC domain-containing protein [Longimicrobiaceae bacterium]